MSLRLTVDARVVVEDTRGIGRYARAILRRLVARGDVELTLLVPGLLPFLRRAAYERALGSSRFLLRSRAGRRGVIWHPANGTFFSSRLPSVVTLHDAVPFRFPADDPRKRAHDQQPFLRSVRTADRIVAVSNFGRDEICAVFGVAREGVEVIYHGVEPSFSPGVAQGLPNGILPGKYLLFVGDPLGEPRKNFAMLYEALNRAWPDGNGPLLVVAGARAPELPRVRHAGNLGDDLHGSGNEAMRALYRGAIALAMASYHETFGMPAIEAMACGTPVVASAASCLPEIGGDAPLYAPPGDVPAWADALRRVVAEPALRDRLRVAGLERATHFDWETSAGRHAELFASLQ
ncbi:MAG TPA: glycosyltransferase family 1 protein [Verrucomicrobiae bacterium]|nr:glycosyltransferase family 1 protein [Verrucomicrobiae bacterium]